MNPDQVAAMQQQRQVQQPQQQVRNNSQGAAKMKGKFFSKVLGEKFIEAMIFIGAVTSLGYMSGIPASPETALAIKGLSALSGVLFFAFILFWFDFIKPDLERSLQGYVIAATLFIAFMVAGVHISVITENLAKGGKVIVGEVYSGSVGVITGATGSTTTVQQSGGSTVFSDTDKGSYAGTVPCQSLDWSKASNVNVQNGTGGAREWCTAGANALGGNANARFAKTCGCTSPVRQ